MEKFQTKVNMKSIKIFIFIGLVLFLGLPTVYAQIDRGNSVRMEYSNDLDGGGKSVMQNFMEIFLGGEGNNFGSTTPSSSSTTSTSNNNSSTNQTIIDPNQLATYPTPQTVNGFKVYRQCDYRNVKAVNGCSNSGTLCAMGCGITSASMIISTLTGANVDPPTLLQKYQANDAYISCTGTDTTDAKKIIESYGLKTSGYLYNYGHTNAATVEKVAPDIREKVKNGWYIFALMEFCSGGCGHFIVITDIDNNNVVTSYDPYYEPGNSHQPINYNSRSPYPKYRTAFAVRK